MRSNYNALSRGSNSGKAQEAYFNKISDKALPADFSASNKK